MTRDLWQRRHTSAACEQDRLTFLAELTSSETSSALVNKKLEFRPERLTVVLMAWLAKNAPFCQSMQAA